MAKHFPTKSAEVKTELVLNAIREWLVQKIYNEKNINKSSIVL